MFAPLFTYYLNNCKNIRFHSTCTCNLKLFVAIQMEKSRVNCRDTFNIDFLKKCSTFMCFKELS